MKSLSAMAIITTFALSSLAMPVVGQPPATDSTPAPTAGWALCDGSDGTPDLSNRFVLGVGAAEYLGSTGGSHAHKHRAGNHSHQIDPPGLRLRPVYGYSGYRGTGARSRSYALPEQTFNLRSFKSGPTTVIPDSVSHLPPYYKIAFIMKQ